MLPKDLLTLLWEFNGTYTLAQIVWDFNIPWEEAIALSETVKQLEPS